MDLFERAVSEYKCPYCESEKGKDCITPKGRKAKEPHGARQWKVVIADRLSCFKKLI